MRIPAKTTRRFAALALATAAVFASSGCGFYDLGEFEDEEDYYSSFGNVGLIAQNGTQNDYSLKKYFYNEHSVNDFSGDIVEADEYVYFVLPVEKTMELDSVALYVYAEERATVRYSVFLTDTVPTNLRNYDAPLYVQEEDEEGNPKFDEEGNPVYEQEEDADGNPKFDEEGNPVYEKIPYDDPAAETAAATGSFTAKANQWDSFTVEKWKSDAGKTADTVEAEAGTYVLIRFENNSGYGKDAELQRIPFRATNLLVRATRCTSGVAEEAE